MKKNSLFPMTPTRRDFLKTAALAPAVAAMAQKPASPIVVDGYPDLAALQAAHENKGIIPPNKTYRMMEWEFHTPPEADFKIDWEGAMKAARDAGAESMMFYSQDHWGYAHYASDVAVRHPHLDGDMFGREVALARKLGMSVVCYYSLQFNNQSILKHPDWGWVNEKGEFQRQRWYIACLDTPYRQYVLKMMDEIFSRYEIDELFLDIFGIQFHLFHSSGMLPYCFCKYTEEAWAKDHPGDDYRAGFQTREGVEARYNWHQRRTMSLMLDEIIAVARKQRPNLIVSLNGGPEVFPGDIMQRVSFIYAEPITTPTGISVGSMVMRGWNRPDYQAGIFSKQGYLDTYPGQIPRTLAAGLIAQNSRTFVVGNAPIVTGLDGQGFSKRWFEVAKETWADVRNVDALLDGVEPVTSVAVLYSQDTRASLAVEKRPLDFRRSIVGALETVTFAGRPVESLPEFRLTANDLKQFDLLVLPEVEAMSDQQADAIRKWVDGGGALIATGNCGLRSEKSSVRQNFALADVLGVDFDSEERKYAYDGAGQFKEDVTTIFLESAGHELAKSLAVSTVGLPGSFVRVRCKTAQEVMRFRLPLMVEDMEKNHWYNWGAPPPGSETVPHAVTLNRFGKGQALYAGVHLFRAMNSRPFWIRQWVPELVRSIAPDPVLELHSQPNSEFVHATYFWDKSRKFVIVQVVNAVELATSCELRTVPRVEIRFQPQKLAVKGAKMVWPSKHPVALRGNSIVLENVGRYTALVLKVA
jgi:hypothetical protein